jgi:hypothetical protein
VVPSFTERDHQIARERLAAGEREYTTEQVLQHLGSLPREE